MSIVLGDEVCQSCSSRSKTVGAEFYFRQTGIQTDIFYITVIDCSSIYSVNTYVVSVYG